MIRSELSKFISLITVLVLLLHIILQSAGWWSVQIMTAAVGDDCCGAEYCCCNETDIQTCACDITDIPQTQNDSELLFCGIRSNDRENENNSADVIMEWMEIKALFQTPQTIHQPEFIRYVSYYPDLYEEVISDLNSPPPIS